MDIAHLFVRDEILPSYFENLLGHAIAVLSSNFAVTQLDATHIRVPASAGVGAAVISIQGRPRWVETNVDRAHPGGAAGAYDVFVTAADQAIVNVPQPFTDNTNYGFALAIVASGATPAIVAGTVDIFRKVAVCQWDGAQITEIDPVVNSAPAGWPASGPAGQATLRKLGIGATDAAAGNDSRIPTTAEAQALAGTSGAPANGNRYVTDADPRNTNARTPTGAAGGDLGGTFPNPPVLQSTGQAWPGNAGWLYLKLVGGGALLWDTATGGVILRNNYDPATDRLLVAANPSWQLRLRSSTDQALISRAPATAGAPVYADVGVFTSAGLQDTRFTKGYFGDGSDGAFTLDGAATPAWAVRAGSVYTMSRDCFCTNLTVNAGVTLKTNGWRVFCTGTFTNAGTVSNDGGAGGNGGGVPTSGGASGAGTTRGTLTGAAFGGAGAGGANTTVAGGAGLPPASFFAGTVVQLGGAGGAGGTGSGGAGIAGASGGAQSTLVLRAAGDFLSAWSLFAGGSGGGGGGVSAGGSFQNGGGGGGGGGAVLVVAQTIIHTGAFSAIGGAGGNGNGSSSGSGGGGGGGTIVVIGNRATDTGTYSVAGGAAGAIAGGTGTVGAAGGAGTIVKIAA